MRQRWQKLINLSKIGALWAALVDEGDSFCAQEVFSTGLICFVLMGYLRSSACKAAMLIKICVGHRVLRFEGP